ncbi:MAG: glycosyltransferase [Lewinellaceae bacterium]|nr:glycosyltransferase [Lewinellaceae bacterium]
MSKVQNPIKIVLISPAHPLRGGIAASSERLAQALQDGGHEVVIYSFSLQYPAFLFPGKTQLTDDPAPNNLKIKTRLNSVNPLNWLLVGREIARENPDQIIVRFWLPFMGPSLGSVLRVARLFMRNKFRATFRVTGLVDNIIPHEKRFGDRPFARWFVSACDDFVVMSRSVGEEIRSFLPPSKNIESVVRFAPHPIYDTYGEPLAKTEARHLLNLPENVPTVLFFGFIRKYKGLDLLLEALSQTPEIHAIVAGECYEDWDFYQKIIQAQGLSERVHLFTDFIPAEQVRVFFSAADLVVQPYKSATQSGISQIAYHFDKPMVVTNVGGLPEIVTHGVSGYVVDPEPLAIAKAMDDFYENDRESTMREGVKAEKRRFSWEYLVEKLMG